MKVPQELVGLLIEFYGEYQCFLTELDVSDNSVAFQMHRLDKLLRGNAMVLNGSKFDILSMSQSR